MRPPEPHPDPKPDSHEAFYDHYLPLLVSLGISECGLSQAEAREVAHAVLAASVGSVSRIPDMRAWLTATMRAAARLHRETHVTRR